MGVEPRPSPARRFERRLSTWGASLRGDPRVVAYAALGGAAFSLIVGATAASALSDRGALRLWGQDLLIPGLVVFSLLWALFGAFAYLGWPRVFLCTLMGHLLGYLVMTANLVLARLNSYDALQAGVTLFGLTLLGFLAGVALEVALAAARPSPTR